MAGWWFPISKNAEVHQQEDDLWWFCFCFFNFPSKLKSGPLVTPQEFSGRWVDTKQLIWFGAFLHGNLQWSPWLVPSLVCKAPFE